MSTNQRGGLDGGGGDVSDPKCLFGIQPSAIKIGKEIGKGAFSVVYLGEYNKKRVAVKCQPKDAVGNIPPFVLKEVQMLQRLQHPNLLEYIGAADNVRAKQVWILSEHSTHGDVDQLLKAIRKGSMAHPGWARLVQMALDVAKGIAFMQSQRIIHRDIKSSNILLDANYSAKLCDFGFATDIKWSTQMAVEDDLAGKARRKSYCGTDAYMAPEMFLDEDYNESVDVFSYGVVLMEIICCREANTDGFLSRLPQSKFRISTAEFQDAMPLSCPPALARLAEQCVAFEPSERPSCDSIVHALDEMLAQKHSLTSDPVELRPFTPMSKEVVESEPQTEEGDEDYDYGDDEDDEDDVDENDDDGGNGTVDLDDDEADRSGRFSSGGDSLTCGSDDGVSILAMAAPYHSGIIFKRNRRGNRSWTAKLFTLDHDQLHYSDAPSAKSSTSCEPPSSQSGASTLSSLCLRGCRIWKTMDMHELRFNIVNSSWKIVRELQASNTADLNRWMEHINQGIDYANELGLLKEPGSAPHSRHSKPNNHSGRRKSKQQSAKEPETRCADVLLEAELQDESDEIYQWLASMNLQRFTSTLKAKGFSSLDFVRETGIEKEDLNFLGIKDPAARKAITAAARELRGEN